MSGRSFRGRTLASNNERTESTVSASREKKTRSDATYVQRRNNKEEDKDRRKHVLYGIAGAVVAVLAIALLVWDSGFFQKRSTAVTIDGENFGPAVVQYYYQTAWNNAYYGSVMGDEEYASFDYNADPAGQIYDEETGQTWRDFLMDKAIDDLTQVTALVHAAQAEGYTLTEADQALYDSEMASLDQTWRSSGQYDSLSSYLKLNFGSYMDEDIMRDLYADQVLADSYRNHYQDGLTYTDEELESYYGEHANELDNFGYSVFTIQASVTAETDEDGNTVEKTEEETQAEFDTAKAEAQTLAQEIQNRLAAGEDPQALADEYGDRLYSSSIHAVTVGSTLATTATAYCDWLYDGARTAGEVSLQELDRSESQVYNYYVVQFDSRERDEDPTADVRHILVSAGQSPTEESFAQAEEKAQALLDQWKAGEATEDSFAALAVTNSADSGSASTGGLYTGISSIDSMEPNFLNWALDSARQPGDTGIVKNESSAIQGWHIMYFVGWDDPAWKCTARDELQAADGSAWLASLTDGVEAVRGSGLDHVS